MQVSAPTGRLNLESLREMVGRSEIETVLTVFPDLYGRLLGKRITGDFFLEHAAVDGMHVCDYLLACDMEMDPVPGYRLASWEKGYGDLVCMPDLSTLRVAAWLPKTAIVLCDLLAEAGPVEQAPRRILHRQIQRARQMGLRVMGGSEIEFYLFRESYDSARGKQYHDLETASSYPQDYHILQGAKDEEVIGEIRRSLEESAVPVEFTKGEWGAGQQEINLRYSEAMEQADRNALYKHLAKEIAWRKDRAVTFMAKWNEKTAGSSMHVHLSLWDLDGQRNLFDGAASSEPAGMTDAFRWFLGGWMAHTRALTAFYAPYPTSYKRFQPGSFAPTRIGWGVDNRTAGFRVVGRGPSLRIECRIPGADANPYLVYAASLAAGLDGISRRTEPPRPHSGDAYAAEGLPSVPETLREAISELESSRLASEAFGPDVVEHYLHFLRTEQRKLEEVVTCWERARYFERA